MVSFRQRSVIFLTFLLALLALALLAGGLGTQYWVVAQAEIQANNKSTGFIHFGLFEGTRRLDFGYGERNKPMDILDILYKERTFMIKDLYNCFLSFQSTHFLGSGWLGQAHNWHFRQLSRFSWQS